MIGGAENVMLSSQSHTHTHTHTHTCTRARTHTHSHCSCACTHAHVLACNIASLLLTFICCMHAYLMHTLARIPTPHDNVSQLQFRAYPKGTCLPWLSLKCGQWHMATTPNFSHDRTIKCPSTGLSYMLMAPYLCVHV